MNKNKHTLKEIFFTAVEVYIEQCVFSMLEAHVVGKPLILILSLTANNFPERGPFV